MDLPDLPLMGEAGCSCQQGIKMTPTAVNRGGAEILGPIKPEYDAILTNDALAFVAQLVRKHRARHKELLAARQKRAKELDSGRLPDFLPETKSVRDGDWKIAG